MREWGVVSWVCGRSLKINSMRSGIEVTESAMVRSRRLFLIEKYEQNAADSGKGR